MSFAVGRRPTAGANDFYLLQRDKFATPSISTPSTFQDGVDPFAHQLRAAALGVRSQNTPFKGMILGDTPGLGKTLALLLMIEESRQPHDGPVLLVVPPSCARQWVEELRTNLKEVCTDPLRRMGACVNLDRSPRVPQVCFF